MGWATGVNDANLTSHKNKKTNLDVIVYAWRKLY